MNHGVLWLFAIPAVCIFVIGFAQFKDEMFKKKFIIDRRMRRSEGNNPNHNRRYSDRRQTAASEAVPEASPDTENAANPHILETSGTSH